MAVSSSKSVRKPASFRDRLSRLTHHQACQLLGENGDKLLLKGAREWDIDPELDTYLGRDLFRVRIADGRAPDGKAIVVITQMSGKNRGFHLRCDQCNIPCLHGGAALNLLLTHKLLLGLAAPPDETVPLELLTEAELMERALAERRQRARTEKMSIRSADPGQPWTEYILSSHLSGKTYRVALRGDEDVPSYCSCPDFRTNHLGTCKHILHVLDKVRKRFNKAQLKRPFRCKKVELYLYYRDPTGVRFNLPDRADAAVRKIVGTHTDHTLTLAQDAVQRLRKLEAEGHDVLVYPDAEEWIEAQLTLARLREATVDIRRDPQSHALRKELLKTELLPYQLDGIAFAVGTGRAILADDMGLGKTIQGIGTAELLARLAGIQRVLVVCPATLKSQWRDEIHRFSERSAQLIYGGAQDRAVQYAADTFFTVCNYEQVLRDLEPIERAGWDLIILDEGQRIKNWESKTSQVIRSLRSRFALVLSGTPLENRLEELYTVVRFADERRLGPAYQFLHRHRRVSEKGRLEGYQRLDEIREQLRPILLRRTRRDVMRQLPERTTSVERIAPTQEQIDLHNGYLRTVVKITKKPFLTEMDLLLLQKSLLMCRLAANSTFLVDKQEPEFSSKLDRLAELLEGLAEQPDRKIVLFSEWRKMLDRIEPIVERIGIERVRLDGQVPQKHRPTLVRRFQTEPDCRLIMMTNAGSTGLNLQAANTVINVDLPWNPAVLEQRIARAHRMGQQNPVHVYMLVTEETLEERLLNSLASKQELADAALDSDSDVCEVQLTCGIDELRRRLERLLGEPPSAPVDQSQCHQVERETLQIAERRDRVAAAGGQLLGAAFQLVGELVATSDRPAPDPQVVDRLRAGLAQHVERDADGRPQLKITLPDDQSLAQLADTLARLLVTK